MGQIWKATDSILERAVAVKMLRSDLVDSEDFRSRLRAEARLAAGLSHPGIAHVYDYVEDESEHERVAFLVMELVDGQPLSAHLVRRDPPDLVRIVSILDQAAEALGAAHAVGIVHRDVKPGNLIVTPDGRVKVTDFGIARAMNSVAITEVGQVIGTARYMSPEQARGEEATPASDVYSLAVVGYEMLAGRPPFVGDNPAAIGLSHLLEAPPPLPDWIPDELRSLIDRSLAKAPGERPSDGASFANTLRCFVSDSSLRDATSRFDSADSATGPIPFGGMEATACFEPSATVYNDSAPGSDGSLAAFGRVPPAMPLLGDGWLTARRHRRQLTAVASAVAVIGCLVVLAAFIGGGTRGDSLAATSTVLDPAITVADPAAAVDLVTVDPASYLGLTETEARTALSAAGLEAVTTTAASTADLTGLVTDVQPSGPVTRGSTVSIVVGDGTILAATEPPAVDPGNNDSNGKSKGKGKGKG